MKLNVFIKPAKRKMERLQLYSSQLVWDLFLRKNTRQSR